MISVNTLQTRQILFLTAFARGWQRTLNDCDVLCSSGCSPLHLHSLALLPAFLCIVARIGGEMSSFVSPVVSVQTHGDVALAEIDSECARLTCLKCEICMLRLLFMSIGSWSFHHLALHFRMWTSKGANRQEFSAMEFEQASFFDSILLVSRTTSEQQLSHVKYSRFVRAQSAIPCELANDRTITYGFLRN